MTKFKFLFFVFSVLFLVNSNISGSEIDCEILLQKQSKNSEILSRPVSGNSTAVYFSNTQFQELKEKYSHIYKNITPEFPYDIEEEIWLTEDGKENYMASKEKMAFIPQHCAYITEDRDVFLSTALVQNCIMLWSISISRNGEVLKRGGLHFDLGTDPRSCQKFVSDMEVQNGHTFYYLDTNYITDNLVLLYTWLSEKANPRQITVNAKNIGGEICFYLINTSRPCFVFDKIESLVRQVGNEVFYLIKEYSRGIEYTKNLTFPPIIQENSLEETIRNVRFIPSCPTPCHSAQSYWIDLSARFVTNRETETIFLYNYNSSQKSWAKDSSFEFQRFASILYASYQSHLSDRFETDIVYLYEDIENSYVIKNKEPFVMKESPMLTYVKYIRAVSYEISEKFSEEMLSGCFFIKDVRISFEDKVNLLKFNTPKLQTVLNRASKIKNEGSLIKALEILKEALPEIEVSQNEIQMRNLYAQITTLIKGSCGRT